MATIYTPYPFVRAVPWLTASVVHGVQRFEFPRMSNNISVTNAAGAGPVRIAFSATGFENGNYVQLDVGDTFTEALSVDGLFLSGSGNEVHQAHAIGTTPRAKAWSYTLDALSGSSGVG